ncbi:hypothetical protein B484DRAFT_141700 [Ochromonadaceae sp. CCMP2298]|nr:hypothetical protein B484DRAFT_141700 [Ochromonadaceae sp. CCMP2298]
MDNTVFPEAKILDLVISYAVGNSNKDRYYSEAPYDYLKKARGLTLVSKEFYNSVFRNHPDFVICKAHSELVSLLNKAPQLKKIKLTVCATSVGSDMQLFQKNLLFIKKEWKRLSDVLPNLELLDLTPTFHGIDMRYEIDHLHYDIRLIPLFYRSAPRTLSRKSARVAGWAQRTLRVTISLNRRASPSSARPSTA